MTKKIGFLLEKVAEPENLKKAIKNSQRGGKVKRSWQIRKFNAAYNADPEGTVERMRNMILNLDFPEHHSRSINRLADSGKVRQLDDEDYDPWKWLGHAIMQVIQPLVNRSLIMDTSCCIPKRGNIHGVKRMKNYLRRYPELIWFCKSDCKKYYQLIDPDYMHRVLKHKFKDKRFIELIEICVFDYWCGDDIIKAGEDERKAKERGANWRIHKRFDWQPEPRRDRPYHDRKVWGTPGEELRRPSDIRPLEGRSSLSAERV